MAHVYPVLDFPVYGLASGWDGPRWLDFVQGRHGDPVSEVWLMHAWRRAPAPPRPWILVGTLPAARFARLMTRPGQDRAVEVAHAALLALVNRLTPTMSDTERSRYLPRAITMVDRAALEHPSWAEVTWRVDGRPVPARIRAWSGAWAGFCTAVPGVSLVAAAAGLPPEAVDLATVGDGSAYHFRAEEPVRYPDDLEASARAALGPVALDEPTEARPLHDDQLRLLADEPHR